MNNSNLFDRAKFSVYGLGILQHFLYVGGLIGRNIMIRVYLIFAKTFGDVFGPLLFELVIKFNKIFIAT